jgi:hypothetical protein
MTKERKELSVKEFLIIWGLVIIFFTGDPFLAKIIFNYFMGLL